MAAPMFVRKAKWRFFFTLAKILVGKKATAPHFAFAGPGSTNLLCSRIVEGGHQRVLVVTDGPLRALGISEQAVTGLQSAGVEIFWYDGVKPDPTFDQVHEGAQLLRQHDCSVVLAVGGGSSIDAAKAIAACFDASADPKSWVGFNKGPEEALPIYAIPTTAGTGSEATMGAVITDASDHSKNVIAGEPFLPTAVALDAQLMLGLPPAVTAATGLDALTHGIEAYIGVWERGTRRETALIAIKGVFNWLPKAMQTPADPEVRMGMSLAAYYGGVAINQVSVGNVHAIAHQLGALYGIPHGEANALVLPHLLRRYGAAAEMALAELADALDLPGTGSSADRAATLIEAIERLSAESGLSPTHPAIQRSDFGRITDMAITEGDGYFSPKLLTEEDVQVVLAAISQP